MKLDLLDLKAKLLDGQSTLVDPGYIEPEIKLLHDFYSKSDDKPPEIKKYFDENQEFQFEKFLRVYLLNAIGLPTTLSYDESGWLIIGI